MLRIGQNNRLLFRRRRREVLTVPSGFGYTPPMSINRSGSSFNVGTFDVATLAPTGKAYYVSTSGNNSNDGLTAGTALRSIATALQKSDVDVVYVAAGVYARSNGFGGLEYTRSVSVIATGGRVVSTTHATPLTWTLDGTHTNTYTTTRSATVDVLDISRTDANGDYEQLTARASAADVNANPGSWFLSGSTVYLRTSDDRVPDSNIWVIVGESAARWTGNVTVYLENIDIVGGSECLWVRNSGAGQTAKLYAKNCTFSFSHAGNGVRTQGVDEQILVGCVAHNNAADGFNYHPLNSVVPRVVEINCTGRDNGLADNNDNGSSAHDGGMAVRVGGSYYRNRGPNVVESFASSWNLGVTANDSTATTSASNVNFWAASVSSMWLDRCVSSGSDFDLIVGSGDTIRIRGNIITSDGNNNIGAGGTITTY